MSQIISPRCGHSTTIVKQYAIVIGGTNGEVALNDTWALDSRTDKWTGFGTHGDGPCPRFAHTATLLAQNLILVFGGYDSHTFYNDLYILDLNVRKWSEVEVLGNARPPPRYAHTATIVGRQLVVFGGQGKNAALNDLWIFDLETLTWMSPTISGEPPLPRSYHTANLIGDKLLIFGGKKSSQWHNDFIMLDIPDRSWNRVELKAAEQGKSLTGRAYHSANVFNDNFIVVFGGYNGTNMARDVMVIDLSSFSWKTYKTFDKGLCKHTGSLMVSDSNSSTRLVLFGGHDGVSFTNRVTVLPTDPIFEFVSMNFPRQKDQLTNIPGLPEAKIDKENALVHNTEGIHVQPGMLASHVEMISSSLNVLTQQLEIMDQDMLAGLTETLEVVLQKAKDEMGVREMQAKRKKKKPTVKFGEVQVRSYDRAVGHGSVPSSGGPALGIDSTFQEQLLRRLSSYENLRQLSRACREDYMKTGYRSPQERAKILEKHGTSRPSMELNMKETHMVKKYRQETAEDVSGVLISEAGLLPTAIGDMRFRESEDFQAKKLLNQ